MELKKLKINELAQVCGVSSTAVTKKCITDPDNPEKQYYRGVMGKYEIIMEQDEAANRAVKKIIISDEQLEAEILKAQKNKGYKPSENHNTIDFARYTSEGVINGYKTPPLDIDENGIINVAPVENSSQPAPQADMGQINNVDVKAVLDSLQNLTKDLTNNFSEQLIDTTRQYMGMLSEKDNKILMLTDKERQKENEIYRLQAENKALEEQKQKIQKQEKRYKIIALILSSMLLIITTVIIIFSVQNRVINHNEEVINPVANVVSNPQNPPETKVNTPASQNVKKTASKPVKNKSKK